MIFTIYIDDGAIKKQVPVVDFHCHIYPEKIAEKATKAVGEFYDTPMCELGLTQKLIESGTDGGTDRFVVHSVATSPHQVESINRFISNEVKKSDGRFIGFGTLHPDGDIKSDVQTLVNFGLKGIKIHPDFQKFRLDSENSFEIFEQARIHSLPVLIHTGDKRYDFSNPDRLIPVLESFKDSLIIGAHFGGWSVWQTAAKQLSKYENLMVDSSSALAFFDAKYGTELVKAYGADRVLYGTDFPMWNAQEEICRFNSLQLTLEEKEKILYKNACKVLDITI